MALDKEQTSNYRPVSNLCTPSKVLQRLALNRLHQQLTGSPNFSRLQSAYRLGHWVTRPRRLRYTRYVRFRFNGPDMNSFVSRFIFVGHGPTDNSRTGPPAVLGPSSHSPRTDGPVRWFGTCSKTLVCPSPVCYM
jgi:hypothetical protein